MKVLMLISFSFFTSLGLLTTFSSIETSVENEIENPTIDYSSFKKMTNDLEKYRRKRRVNVAVFNEMSKDENTIILDTRSADAYRKMHVKGAVHLNFSDFNVDKLAAVIPSKKTRILIYCNNNFRFGPSAFAAKMPPLALNIPTFINLHGYGYENIYELGPLLPIDDSQLEFEGEEISFPK